MGQSYEEILEFAIRNEQDAAAFYRTYADKAKSTATARLLRDMAAMEEEHEAILRSILAKHSTIISPKESEVADLRISDYLIESPLVENSPIEDVYIHAMKAEENARLLYKSLAQRASDPEARELFEQLAGQEKKHKLDLETEYDSGMLSWN